MLGGDDFGQFALALIEQFPETENDLLGGGGDRRLDVLGGAQVDELGLLAKGRVKDRRGAVAGGRDFLSADPVRDNLQFGVIRHSLLFLGC